MLISMTGFGKASRALDSLQLTVELKSVNNRFLDINCKLPSGYSLLEPRITALLRSSLRRGRVDVVIVRKTEASQTAELRVNRALVSAVSREMRLLAAEGIPQHVIDLVSADILSRREVIEYAVEEQAVSDDLDAVLATVAEALQQLCQMRAQEGQAIQAELERLLGEFVAQMQKIHAVAKTVMQTVQQRLRERIALLLAGKEVDESRLHQEIAYLADKADITEELTRIESHLEQFRETLGGGEAGRKLEFLLQELGREINTCGSKSQDIQISRAVVEAKAVLEKLREQVLNVE